MRRWILLFFFALGFVLPSSLLHAEEVSCVCEDLTCNACETQTNLTFYTSKCGPNNARVKSCKRPTCVPVPNQKQCLAELEKSTKEPEAKREVVAETPAQGEAVSPPIGSVAAKVGAAKIVRTGAVVNSDVNANVFEGDIIETEKDGKVRLAFTDGTVLNIAPDSKMTIEKHAQESGRKKTLLNLMYGKMRSQVNKNNHYDDQGSYFRVKTRSAVAGVRGTDFVTTFIPGRAHWITKVQTLEGKVRFGSERPNESQENRSSELGQDEEISAGQWATFTMPAPKGDVTDPQLNSYIAKGLLSRPQGMSKEEAQALNQATDYQSLVSKVTPDQSTYRAPSGSKLCHGPEGDFGTCSYTCEGERCSKCVRRSCDASGHWGLPTHLGPSSCDPNQVVVRSQCD